MQKCKNWKKYKGDKPPKCNEGEGCELCTQRYMSRIRAEMNKRFRTQQTQAAKK